MTIDAAQLANLSDQEKRALLARLLEKKARQGGEFPLSYSQRQLWFLDQMEGEQSTYNVTSLLRLEGDLHRDALIRSMKEIVRRHAGFRTTFTMKDGNPVQVVHPEMDLKVVGQDLRAQFEGLGEEEATKRKDEVLTRMLKQEGAFRFDLAKGPLLKVFLLELGDNDHALLLNIHHIVTDGWSTRVLVNELAALYRAYMKDLPSPLPALALQYSDYAVWQHKWLESDEFRDHLSYWTDNLGDVPPLLELPLDKPRPAVQDYRAKAIDLHLDKAHMNQIIELGRRQGATLFMTLLAAYQLLLSRYAGQRAFAISTPHANRGRKELETLIGFFVNTITLRADIDESASFKDLLKAVKQTTLKAYHHKQVPFDRVVDALQLERSLSHNPLAQARFLLKNVPNRHLTLPHLKLTPTVPEMEMGQNDLLMAVTQNQDGLAVRLQYNANLFETATIHRLLAHFRTLLEEVVAHPDRPLAALSMLTSAEHRDLRDTWNGGVKDIPERDAVALFEQVAITHADRPAVRTEQETLTFHDLNRSANRLAHFLMHKGLNPGDVVGLHLDQSIALATAITAVLKAGGVFVVIDPDMPGARVQQMAESADIRLLLTTDARPDAFSNLEVITLTPTLAADQSEAPVDLSLPANRPAYIVFTSGSTGTPKGVVVSHQALVNYATLIQDYGFQPGDTHASPATVSADLWLTALLGSLAVGGTWLPISKPLRTDVEALARLFEIAPVDFLKIVPVHMTALLKMADPERLLPRKGAILGGEALDGALVERMRQLRPEIRIINEYGPAEATVGATLFEVIDTHTAGAPVPIGKSLPNYQAHLLDAWLNPVPVGVKGELFIGGVSLADGYVNQPGLTAERFVPHPLADQPGSRLYRTGDMAIRNPDGDITFLGRSDFQVKIRGFRVEIHEIETALAKHPAVADNVVTARADDNGIMQLAAFLVPQQGHELSGDSLRTYLKPILPDYMTPSHFIFLERLPLTDNGKVDLDALPDIAPEPAQTPIGDGAPSSDTQTILAAIWADILGLDSVGVHDNFFSIGGDSIQSILVISQARTQGLTFTPQDLFDNPTIAQLAEVVSSDVTVGEQGAVTGDVPLTAIQHWFFEQEPVHPNHWNQALVLEAVTGLDQTLLAKALSAMVEHHDQLRARFSQTDGVWTQTIDPPTGGVFPMDLIEIAEKDETGRQEAFLAHGNQLQASLDLNGPLLRAAFFTFGDDTPSRLLLVIHHLVVDGVSWRILVEDLHTAYHQLAENSQVNLPPKTTSFQAWSKKVSEYAKGEATHTHLSYWRQAAADEPSHLPVDTSGANRVGDAVVQNVTLDAETTQKLLQEAPAAYQTEVNDLLLTALMLAFHEWTAQAHLSVSLEGHGREELFEDADTSRTVGWFTSMFPISLRLSEPDSPAACIKETKEILRSIPARGVHYGLLRYLNPDHDASQTFARGPQPKIRFNYLGQFDTHTPKQALFRLIHEHAGAVRHQDQLRDCEIDVNSWISGGSLCLAFQFSPRRLQPSDMERVAQAYLRFLKDLVNHCLAPDAGGFTPSDFEEMDFDQDELDDLMGEIEAADAEVFDESGSA